MRPEEVSAGIQCSLQGWPEESSPEDQVDTRRISRALAERYTGMGFRVNLVDREDFGGTGDYYSAGKQLLDAWGALFKEHIHQDDWNRPGQSGWMVLYNPAYGGSYDLALCLRDAFQSQVPYNTSIPERNGLKPDTVPAVLKTARSVIIECGMYRLSTDEQRAGVELWARAIAAGTLEYLKRFHGLILPGGGKGKMFQLNSTFTVSEMEGGLHVYSKPEVALELPGVWKAVSAYLVLKNEAKTDGEFWLYVTPWSQDGPVFHDRVPHGENPGSRRGIDLAALPGVPKTGGFSLTVKSTVPLVPELAVYAVEV